MAPRRHYRMMPSRSTLSLEAELVLLTAAGTPRGQQPVSTAGVDWSKLAILAHQEGATALVWRWLSQTGTNGMPPDVRTQWRKLAMVSEFRILQLERTLHGVLETLERHGIDAMLLKGSALAYTAYESFAERPMSDLDVLVRSAQAAEAWKLLQKNGWTWPADRWPTEHYDAHQHLPPLINESGGEGAGETRLEIHTALLPAGHPFRWPVDAVWQHARRLRVHNRPVLVPDVLHQLLHVCLHFVWSHEMRWGSWRAVRDVAALARSERIAWQRFIDMARETQAVTCCYWTLRLARHIGGAHVPEQVLRELRPPRPEGVLRRLERHYVQQLFATEPGCPSDALRNALWEAGLAPRWSGHGAARPWQVLAQWNTIATASRSRMWWIKRLLSRVRHAAQGLAYLARLTASRFPRPA